MLAADPERTSRIGTMAARLELNDWPIRYKLIAHFLLISIIPSIILGATIGWTVDRIIERQVNEHTLQLISKVNQSLEFYAGHMQNITYLISFHPEVQSFMNGNGPVQETAEPARESHSRANGLDPGDPVHGERHYEIRKFLQQFTTLYPEVAGIVLVNRQGDYISNEMYARTSDSLTEESWYQQAVESEGIFRIMGTPSGRNLTSHIEYRDEDVISVARAIMDPDSRQVAGVILIDLKLRIIAETVKNVRLGKTGYLMVVDDQGIPIYRSLPDMKHQVPLERLRGEPTGSFSDTVDGEHLQFVYRKSNFTNWTTVAVFPVNESVLEMREIRFYLISFVFVVCLLGIAASWYLSLTLSRPIGQLMSFMRKAESGDLNIRYTGNRKDEVGLLGRSFNRMLMQIRNLIRLTERHERQKREAELRSLQAYIKPHFLYNTLDTVHWMARKKGADDVAEVVESLSSLFRIGLSKGGDRIRLDEEIEHVRHYLNIQRVRYQDKLNWTIHCDSGLEDVVVLKMILQPIVENAIYHGIKQRRGPGQIEIEAAEQDGKLELAVRDDGVGMLANDLRRLQHELDAVERSSGSEEADGTAPDGRTIGYGILNVQERIRLTFGNEYGIELDSVSGRGTLVVIRLPLVRERKPGRYSSEGNGK